MIVFHGILTYFTVFHRISCSTKKIQSIHGREFPEDPLELAVLKLKNRVSSVSDDSLEFLEKHGTRLLE